MSNPTPAVLVVDDMQSIRRIIVTILRQIGIKEIYEADNGKSALALLGSKGIDLVFTDWNMPEMDGITLLRHIRADSKLKHLPVMMITAEGTKDNVTAAKEAGASGYILKPFTPAKLAQVVQLCIERQAA